MIVEYYGTPELFNMWFGVYTRKLFQALKGQDMGTTADIQKLVERMKRASILTDRAAKDGDKHEATMDRFESRLNSMGDHFGKIDEYEKQLAAMEQLGNGGPPLTDTFPKADGTAPEVTVDTHPRPHLGVINPATGDPIK